MKFTVIVHELEWRGRWSGSNRYSETRVVYKDVDNSIVARILRIYNIPSALSSHLVTNSYHEIDGKNLAVKAVYAEFDKLANGTMIIICEGTK